MSDGHVHSGSSTQNATPSGSGAAVLPFDIVHELLDFASIIDVVSLCNTCKALRAHLKNESIWKRACAPYGLQDLSRFGGRSAYTIYTQLLRPYASLLGIWANDWPFYGRMLEFRLSPGDEDEQGGIIGELWTFSSRSPPDSPTPPIYTRVLKLSFEDNDLPQSELSENPLDAPEASAVNLVCVADGPHSRHRATLVRLSETPLGKFVQYYRRRVNLPDFPPHISPWYDTGRGLPRIPEVPETTDHHRELIKLYPAARLPAVFVAPTAVTKPPAISIVCGVPPSQHICRTLHAPPLAFPTLDDRAPRYYPLRSCILAGIDPASDRWSVDNLDGIWYGSYGPNGTECIYLAHDEEHGTVEATKITGDLHVPRGCVSWIVHLPLDNQMPTLQGYWTSVRSDGVMPNRLLMGHGTIAGRGFTDMAIVELMAGVVSADQIDIFWAELHEFRTYKRYKGRAPT
ncbi:hypothetical protein BN946_scf185042.g33 [Trametes cinnabarina]|uniref:F-box domain-containing protein n=1 Tax=Pycnoporus cinnabarinus TaxID=5643 RepID=A0A060S4K3_PYCCI|nr:hypothetical protein BN946_scf185042.g33 [Trametes cinnabarina]